MNGSGCIYGKWFRPVTVRSPAQHERIIGKIRLADAPNSTGLKSEAVLSQQADEFVFK